ncbi:membrane lipoprotein [Streptomyces xiamenensis]|uniref:membrane lipoprotein n=1 Tax=Streptomyces xiamenensis TaxID=408015 RepID=UPI00342EEDAE
MIPQRSARRRLTTTVLLLPLLALPLTACGSEGSAAPAAEAADPTPAGTSAAPDATDPSEPADPPEPTTPADPSAPAEFPGVAPELIYLTEIPGYTLAPQSAGVIGEDGWGCSYVSATGGTIELRVERAEPGAADTDITADRAAGITEFHRIRDGVRISVLTTDPDADPDLLRAALEAAHPADAAELAEALPQEDGGAPVRRGDLPPHGDGAPLDPEGAAG